MNFKVFFQFWCPREIRAIYIIRGLQSDCSVTVRRANLAQICHPPPDAEKVFDLIGLLRQHILKGTSQVMSLYRLPVSYPDQKVGYTPQAVKLSGRHRVFLWHIVPSWQQIEDRIRQEMGYQSGARYRNHWGEPAPSLSLNIRRVASVRSAFHQAEWQASDLLRQRFSDLDISSILKDLIDVVTQMAMIVAGSSLTGGAIGAGVGAFFGGAGAVPMGAAGAAMGLQVSSWILGMLGLQSIAEFFVEGLPRIGGYYLTGINTAWEGTRGEEGLTPFSQDDPLAVSSAAHNIALGHVEVVILLLGAIVEYLTRGRGNAGSLAQEMRASPKGARIGQWMVEHEDALKGRPDLQKAETRKGAIGSQETPAPAPSPRSDTHSPRSLKPRRSYENPENLISTQTKSEMSGSQIKRLTKDMEKNGFDPNHPVDVWRNPNTGRLEIQDGHHRAAAAKKAGIEKIPVDIWE